MGKSVYVFDLDSGYRRRRGFLRMDRGRRFLMWVSVAICAVDSLAKKVNAVNVHLVLMSWWSTWRVEIRYPRMRIEHRSRCSPQPKPCSQIGSSFHQLYTIMRTSLHLTRAVTHADRDIPRYSTSGIKKSFCTRRNFTASPYHQLAFRAIVPNRLHIILRARYGTV